MTLPDMTISDETVALIRAAQAQVQRAGITSQSGLVGYVLEAPAKAIVPIITPVRNLLPRRMGRGAPSVNWKAITSFDTNRALGTMNEGQVPTAVNYNTVNMNNIFATIALSNSVSFQAQWRGRSLEGDVRARRTAELLYQLMVVEERWLLTASQYLMAPPLPVLATTTTGGTVAANTYWVAVTAVNSAGESIPGTLPASSIGSPAGVVTTTGATSAIQLQIATVPNATYYNVYIGSGASKPANGAMYLQTTLSGAVNAPQPGFNVSVTLSSGGSATSAESQGPVILQTLSVPPATGTANPPVTNSAKTSVDTVTGNINIFDGVLAQALNNVTTGGTLGAQVLQPAASTGLLQITDLDNLLLSLYQQSAGDPDILVMNPIMSGRLTNLQVNANQTRYVIEANSPQQSALTANYRITHYINKMTGKAIPIVEDRYCPVDTLMAIPLRMPFPVADVANAIEIETNQEYWGVDFAVTNSTYSFADYLESCLKIYFLGGLGIIRGCTPSL